tara:strand:+ start:63 stop:305 length:243 start_codon:yes stop_codon:yes gene_type:complete
MTFDEMTTIARHTTDDDLADDLASLTPDCFPVLDELITAWVEGGYLMRGGLRRVRFDQRIGAVWDLSRKADERRARAALS